MLQAEPGLTLSMEGYREWVDKMRETIARSGHGPFVYITCEKCRQPVLVPLKQAGK